MSSNLLENSKIIKRSDNQLISKFNESIALRVLGNNNVMNCNTGDFIPYVWHKHLKSFNVNI